MINMHNLRNPTFQISFNKLSFKKNFTSIYQISISQVSGLPAHLLPHPPSRTSPVFEKLKKTLSRSPSPKDFAQAVSTVASIISTHPSINQELGMLRNRFTLIA